MRSTTFFTTALQVGTFLTAAEAAHPKRRQAQGYGANEDSVQWGTWSATTFQTVTTPYYKPEEAKPTYNSWAAVPNQPYKPPYVEGVDEEWNNWQEDEYTTTRKPLVIPTPYNPFSSTTKPYTQGYQSWEQGPNKYVTTETYNSWEQAKPSPTTYNYQSWVGAAEKRYNGEDYQGWQEASTKTPEVYQTWSQTMTRRPTQDFQNWQATPTNVISYSTKVVTIEEYESWSQASQSMASTTDAYQTWSQATAVPTKPVEQVQEWGQWQGQQGQGNGYQNGNGYANGNGNGYGNGIFPTTSTPAFNIPAIPTNPAAGLGGAGLGAGAGGVGGAGLPGVGGAGLPGVGGAGGAGLPGVGGAGGAGLPGVGGAGVPGLGGLPGLNALAGAGAGAGLPI